MIYQHSELKRNLKKLVINKAIKEVESFLESVQNDVLTLIASEKYVNKSTYDLPRTDEIFIDYLKSYLAIHEFKYEIKVITDIGGLRDVIIIEWNLNL